MTTSNITQHNPNSSSQKNFELLKKIRNITGISAEFLMTFLEYFPNQKEQHIIYSLCCNFHRLQHSIEISLINHGIDLNGIPYDPNAFTNISYVDVDLVEEIQEFLKQRENTRITSQLFVN